MSVFRSAAILSSVAMVVVSTTDFAKADEDENRRINPAESKSKLQSLYRKNASRYTAQCLQNSDQAKCDDYAGMAIYAAVVLGNFKNADAYLQRQPPYRYDKRACLYVGYKEEKTQSEYLMELNTLRNYLNVKVGRSPNKFELIHSYLCQLHEMRLDIVQWPQTNITSDYPGTPDRSIALIKKYLGEKAYSKALQYQFELAKPYYMIQEISESTTNGEYYAKKVNVTLSAKRAAIKFNYDFDYLSFYDLVVEEYRFQFNRTITNALNK